MIAAAYIDTSALLRLFFEGEDSNLVSKAIQTTVALYASRLVLSEARVTFARGLREGRVSPADYRELLDGLDDFWEAEIQPLEVGEAVFQCAEHVAERVAIRALDAIHLGHARILRRELALSDTLAIISCDRRLLQAAVTLGFETPIPPEF